MKFSYGIFGCGVGEAIASALLSYPDTKSVTILDRDPSCLAGASSRLKSPEKLITKRINLRENTRLNFKKYDVIINALPAKFSPQLAEAALRENKGFCDLGGVLNTTLDLMNMSESAKNKSISLVTDCGLMPGLGMMLAKKLIDDLPSVKSVEILVGGLPQKPRPPTNYSLVFSIEGLRHLCQDPAPILRSGKIEWVEPMSDYKKVPIPALAKFSTLGTESFITSGAATTPWNFLELGVEDFCERTVRWENFRSFVTNLKEADFEKEMLPYINTPVSASNPDLVYMKVSAVSNTGATGSFELLDEYDTATGLSAMKRTTGFPTAVVARMIANKEIAPGANTPDLAIPSHLLEDYVEEMQQYFDLKRN